VRGALVFAALLGLLAAAGALAQEAPGGGWQALDAAEGGGWQALDAAAGTAPSEPAGGGGRLGLVVGALRAGAGPPPGGDATARGGSGRTASVGPGGLSREDFDVVMEVGRAFRRHYGPPLSLAAGGCPDERRIYVFSDRSERALHTARAFLAGLAPGCSLPIHRSPQSAAGPFGPSPAGACGPEAARRRAAPALADQVLAVLTQAAMRRRELEALPSPDAALVLFFGVDVDPDRLGAEILPPPAPRSGDSGAGGPGSPGLPALVLELHEDASGGHTVRVAAGPGGTALAVASLESLDAARAARTVECTAPRSPDVPPADPADPG